MQLSKRNAWKKLLTNLIISDTLTSKATEISLCLSTCLMSSLSMYCVCHLVNTKLGRLTFKVLQKIGEKHLRQVSQKKGWPAQWNSQTGDYFLSSNPVLVEQLNRQITKIIKEIGPSEDRSIFCNTLTIGFIYTSWILDARSLFHIFQIALKAAVPAANPTPALATPHKPQKIMGSIPLQNNQKEYNYANKYP